METLKGCLALIGATALFYLFVFGIVSLYEKIAKGADRRETRRSQKHRYLREIAEALQELNGHAALLGDSAKKEGTNEALDD